MKIIHYRIAIMLFGLGLIGCASSTWKQDNLETPDKVMLNNALNKCQFEKKRQEANRYLAGSHTNSESMNEHMKKLHEEKYSEALACMKSEGFSK